MDPATLLGILIAFGAIVAMIVLEGGNITSILLPAPMILVFGATIAVGIASATVKDLGLVVKALPRAFQGKVESAPKLITQISGFAEKARREGLLSLEAEAAKVKDPFLKEALQNVADGMDPEELRELLEEKIATAERTERVAAKFYTTMGGYAPTIGIIGTVVSLTHVLENLSTPDELGHMIAAAFVATLWGVLSSNLLWMPIGTRLTRLTDLMVERRTMAMEGVLAVQAGSQPRAIVERLESMIGVKAPAGKDAAKAGKGGKGPDLKVVA
jgi:chemotaxis protein MotA